MYKSNVISVATKTKNDIPAQLSRTFIFVVLAIHGFCGGLGPEEAGMDIHQFIVMEKIQAMFIQIQEILKCHYF